VIRVYSRHLQVVTSYDLWALVSLHGMCVRCICSTCTECWECFAGAEMPASKERAMAAGQASADQLLPPKLRHFKAFSR
jgi:hypothetical protein